MSSYLDPPPGGSSLEELQQAAGRWGLSTTVLKLDREAVNRLYPPYIVHLKGMGTADHFVVVIGRDSRGNVRIIEASDDRVATLKREVFFRGWSGYALVTVTDRPSVTGTDRPSRVLDLMIVLEVALLALVMYRLARFFVDQRKARLPYVNA